jgi:phosphoglycolate phosphatase-like HAD superfamily hydrolase
MRVIIFDLDFTLAATDDCQVYLTSQVGRAAIIPALREGVVRVNSYDSELVVGFNELRTMEDCRAIVVSDSPKDYCLEVLRLCGYNINPQLVFGAQSKPLVDFGAVEETVAEVLDLQAADLSYLVIGDSPKDIYFAHSIRAPSVFAKWGSRHNVGMVQYSMPSVEAQNFAELREHVNRFRRGELEFEYNNFKSDYIVVDVDDIERVELNETHIGYGREYVADYNQHRGATDRYASKDLHWVVKRSKNYTQAHHNRNLPMQMFGQGGVFDTDPLKRKAGHFKNEFLRWCDGHGISGKILLIPVPPSVPRECNLSHTMAILCGWWATWINAERRNMDIEVHDVFERFWPRQPSHLTEGRRDQDEQFDTLGIFGHEGDQKTDVDYVVIVDDVVTSGSHMSAIASFIRTANLVEDGTTLLGYALFKTVHPEDDDAL